MKTEEPRLIIKCAHCGAEMDAPEQVQLLAEALAAEIVFATAYPAKTPAPDPHLVRGHAPVPPNVDRGT
jgi:hypothetical protein